MPSSKSQNRLKLSIFVQFCPLVENFDEVLPPHKSLNILLSDETPVI